MALITCSECNNQISDKSKQCIHCGNPLTAHVETQNSSFTDNPKSPTNTPKRSLEDIARGGVDFLFSLFYVFTLYVMITDPDIDVFGTPGGFMGLILGFALLIFVHKVVRFIVGTIAKGFSGITK